jgi:hypothetical protein
MQRSPRSVIALFVACLVLAGVAYLEHNPDVVAPTTHAVHAPTQTP